MCQELSLNKALCSGSSSWRGWVGAKKRIHFEKPSKYCDLELSTAIWCLIIEETQQKSKGSGDYRFCCWVCILELFGFTKKYRVFYSVVSFCTVRHVLHAQGTVFIFRCSFLLFQYTVLYQLGVTCILMFSTIWFNRSNISRNKQAPLCYCGVSHPKIYHP